MCIHAALRSGSTSDMSVLRTSWGGEDMVERSMSEMSIMKASVGGCLHGDTLLLATRKSVPANMQKPGVAK